jgi:BirA family biotin operon repressor/biotin-[acetyl-CoA-carboxylase] ligase
VTTSSFDVAQFAALRAANGGSLGAPLSAVFETGSTNDDAFTAAKDGAPHGALFVSDVQTHGRGRRGHAWVSPPGVNLTFSMLLKPIMEAERVSVLSLVVGLAVRAAAARRVSSSVSIKWPNDVLVERKKLAGILVESRLSGAKVDAVVIGVGINVGMRDLPAEIAPIATSLALLGDPAPSREAMLAAFLAEFESRYAAFTNSGLGALLTELRDHDALDGERLKVGDVTGVGAGIAEDGALVLRTDSGALVPVSSGTVERV